MVRVGLEERKKDRRVVVKGRTSSSGDFYLFGWRRALGSRQRQFGRLAVVEDVEGLGVGGSPAERIR